MNIFSKIFSICFIILGALVWMVAMSIVIAGAVGLFRIALKWAIDLDIVEWYARKKEEKDVSEQEQERL